MTAPRPRRDAVLVIVALVVALAAGLLAATGDEPPDASYWADVVGVNIDDVDELCPLPPDATYLDDALEALVRDICARHADAGAITAR